MKKFTYFLTVLLLILLGCNDDPKSLLITTPDAEFNYEEHAIESFIVVSNTKWNAKSDNEWLIVEDYSKDGENDGEVTYKCLRNTTGSSRLGTISLAGDDVGATFFSISQKAFPLYKSWIREGEDFIDYITFNENMTGNSKWYDKDLGEYTDEQVFTYEFSETNLKITLSNNEEYNFNYMFSSDENTLSLEGEDGSYYIYEYEYM